MDEHKAQNAPAEGCAGHQLSRREVVALGGAAAAAAMAAVSPAAAATPTEGFFIVYESKGGGPEPEDARFFFIPSEWLEKFEVTDAAIAAGIEPKDVVKKIRQISSPGVKMRKLRALYSDVADLPGPIGGTILVRPRPLGPSETYLAMMITPAAVP